MLKLRLWITITLIWFFGLLNIERFHEPINIASFVYLLAMFLSLCVITIPPMRDRTATGLVIAALTIFIVFKFILGYPIGGSNLPITITEGLAIIVSVLVAHRLTWSIRQFENSVLEINEMKQASNTLDFFNIQDDIYREIRRARIHERPVSVVTLDAPLSMNNRLTNKLIAEVQKNTLEKHLLAHLTKLISGALNDSDILAILDGKFILVLTESDRERAEKVAEHLTSTLEDFLERSVKFGIASFPDEELTMAGLLEASEANLSFHGFKAADSAAPSDQNGSSPMLMANKPD